MNSDARWKVFCWTASAVLTATSAALFSYTSPSLAGVFASVSALNVLCAVKAYKKSKNDGNGQVSVNSDKNSKNTNQRANVREKILINEDEGLVATNQLSKVRKMIAHNIDETLGTNLEEKKLTRPLKKLEKAISDKLFGKVKE